RHALHRVDQRTGNLILLLQVRVERLARVGRQAAVGGLGGVAEKIADGVVVLGDAEAAHAGGGSQLLARQAHVGGGVFSTGRELARVHHAAAVDRAGARGEEAQ